MPVTITEKAANEVKRIMQEGNQDLDATMLRVGVAGGGCSGFQYNLTFDQAVDERMDEVYDFFGVKVVVDRKSDLYLNGTTVDFFDGLEKRGFTFSNPNATKSCGCGSSFTA